MTKIDQLRPDLVTLDIEMPVMNGLETLRAIRGLYPRLPVIMFSTLTASGATATLDALAAGASDYVTKPANVGSIAESIRSVREQIIPRIHALCARRGLAALRRPPAPPLAPGQPPAGAPPLKTPPAATRPISPLAPGPAAPVAPPVPAAPPRTVHSGQRVDVVAIGCSTGGPDALSRVVKAL